MIEENQEIQSLKPIINEKYFECPRCKRTIIMSWNYQEHRVNYPEYCDACGQLLRWEKKLSDIIKE